MGLYEKDIPADNNVKSGLTLLLMDEIRGIFYNLFDRPWLINIINDLPGNRGNLGAIRIFLGLPSLEGRDEAIILNGITSLKNFIRIIKIWLLPDTAEKFGISPFSPGSNISNPALRKCVAYTLPYNLDYLSGLLDQLERQIIRESLKAG